MYESYIPQIANNLNGLPGNPIQPLVATINCTLWTMYVFLKPKGLSFSIRKFPWCYFWITCIFNFNLNDNKSYKKRLVKEGILNE